MVHLSMILRKWRKTKKRRNQRFLTKSNKTSRHQTCQPTKMTKKKRKRTRMKNIWTLIWKLLFRWGIKISLREIELVLFSSRQCRRVGSHSRKNMKKVPTILCLINKTNTVMLINMRKSEIFLFSSKKIAIFYKVVIDQKLSRMTLKWAHSNCNMEATKIYTKSTIHIMRTRLTQKKEKLLITKTCLHQSR